MSMAVLEGVEASRRVGWARYYAARRDVVRLQGAGLQLLLDLRAQARFRGDTRLHQYLHQAVRIWNVAMEETTRPHEPLSDDWWSGQDQYAAWAGRNLAEVGTLMQPVGWPTKDGWCT